MKNAPVLKIYCLSQPLMGTEWASLEGDKYRNVLPFSWEVTLNIDEAQVIAWDGVISPKGRHYYDQVVQKLKDGKLLLLQGESRNLLGQHPLIENISLDQLRYVELPGWSVLPEELLRAIEECYQKLNHV